MAMPYTTYDKIQEYYMGLDMETTDYITDLQVTRWISETSIKIDTSLRRKYNLPITNGDDLIFLQLIAEKFVVGRADAILRTSANEEETKYLRSRNYSKEAEAELKGLIEGTTLLASTPKNLTPIKYQNRSS